MITQQEAEALATKHIQEYVNQCGVTDTEELGKVLMKLLSTTGQAILATQGQTEAVAIVDATARHLAKPEFSKPYRMERMQ